jgi:hypothetical protein
VRVPVTRIDLQFPEHLFAELGLRKHALHGFFHDADVGFSTRTRFKLFSTSPPGYPVKWRYTLLSLFPAAQPDLYAALMTIT